MLNSKTRKKRKNSKSPKDKNQTKLLNYLETPSSINTSTKKKRTPPSTESVPAKKLNLSMSNVESMEEEMEVTSNNHNSASGNSDSESDASQEEENLLPPNIVTSSELDKKLRSMEKRIAKTMTATIEKLIERALKSLKDDIKSLSASSKIQEKKMEDMGHIKSENRKLKTLIQEVKEENRDLKQTEQY